MNVNGSNGKKGETVERILRAAADIFAEVGFSGARVDEIADRADVNKSTMYYHIGDKETLYAEVIHHVIGNTAETIAREIKDVPDPEEKLKIYIRTFARNIDDHPQLAPIMMREVASGGRYFPEVVAKDVFRIVCMLTEILEEGARKGIFIETFPFMVHLMAVGAIVVFKASGPIRAQFDWIPEPMRNPELRISDGMVGEIEKLILRAIKR